MNQQDTIENIMEYWQDPLQECADSPVVLAAKFGDAAKKISELPDISMSETEVLELFHEQAKRFSGCGANNSERYAVLRRNPKSGWKYIADLITPTP